MTSSAGAGSDLAWNHGSFTASFPSRCLMSCRRSAARSGGARFASSSRASPIFARSTSSGARRDVHGPRRWRGFARITRATSPSTRTTQFSASTSFARRMVSTHVSPFTVPVPRSTAGGISSVKRRGSSPARDGDVSAARETSPPRTSLPRTSTRATSPSSRHAYVSTLRLIFFADVVSSLAAFRRSAGSVTRCGGVRITPRAQSRRARRLCKSGSARVSSFCTRSIAPCVMWFPTKFVVAPVSGFSYPASTSLFVPSGFCSSASYPRLAPGPVEILYAPPCAPLVQTRWPIWPYFLCFSSFSSVTASSSAAAASLRVPSGSPAVPCSLNSFHCCGGRVARREARHVGR
eukprot:31265-Pelagococcus_subviridis.AAC.33